MISNQPSCLWLLSASPCNDRDLLPPFFFTFRRAEIPDKGFQDRSLAGRQWLREYANGCAWGVFQVGIEDTELVGRRFLDATACIFAKTGCTMIGGALAPLPVGRGEAQATRLFARTRHGGMR